MSDPLQRWGRTAAFSTAALLVGSVLWFGWKGPQMGFDPVKVWMYAGGTLFFLAMGGFFAARHQASAWRWMIVALIHSLALAAFGQFVNATGLGVQYEEWVVRGSPVARVDSMIQLLSLYVIGTFVTSVVCFRILRRYAE